MSTGNVIVSFLTGKSWFSSELQSIGMALQANIIVQSRYQNNQRKESYYFWFYRFVQSVLIGYSGGIFGTIFLGKPCPFLVNGDIHMTACLVAFGLVQIILPFVRWIFSPNSDNSSSSSNIIENAVTIPLQIVITSLAQLFRTMGLLKFITVCHLELLSPPYRTISTKYYEIPIFGPILYGTMLGNMGGFVLNGIDGYTQRNGIPYPFQNGIFCGTFYHFYVHDTTGIVGTTLRYYLQPLALSLLEQLSLTDKSNLNDDELFATIAVSLFMQIVAILQLPMLYGPTFSPFVAIFNQFGRFIAPFQGEKSAEVNVGDVKMKATNSSTKRKGNTAKKVTSDAKEKKSS